MSAPIADLRVALGYEVEPSVSGPYELAEALTDGTLDRGIVARRADGTRVVIGEIWAACPTEGGGKTRIDAQQVATEIIALLNVAEASAG